MAAKQRKYGKVVWARTLGLGPSCWVGHDQAEMQLMEGGKRRVRRRRLQCDNCIAEKTRYLH